jgi:hypothetical protein
MKADIYFIFIIIVAVLLWTGAHIGRWSVKNKTCPGIHIRHDMMVHGTDTFRCAKPSPEAIKYFESQN